MRRLQSISASLATAQAHLGIHRARHAPLGTTIEKVQSLAEKSPRKVEHLLTETAEPSGGDTEKVTRFGHDRNT